MTVGKVEMTGAASGAGERTGAGPEVGPEAGPLAGLRLVVTGGAARAYLDAVRFLTSASTGATAAALAAEALRRGASVTYLHAPGARRPAAPPAAGRLSLVEAATVADAAAALRRLAPMADAVIHAMAVPDFAPAAELPGKRPSRRGPWRVTLRPTPKLLDAVRAAAPGAFLVAFKLEATEDPAALLAAARRLLAEGRADLVVANRLGDVRPRARRAWLVRASGEAEEVRGLGRLAGRVLDDVLAHRRGDRRGAVAP